MHQTARRRICFFLASSIAAVTIAQPALAAGPCPIAIAAAIPAASPISPALAEANAAGTAIIAEQLVELGYSEADAAGAAAQLTADDLEVLLACPKMMQNAGNSSSHTTGIILGVLLLGGLIALAAAGDGSITTSTGGSG